MDNNSQKSNPNISLTNHQLRQAINDTSAALRPPIMGARVPDDVAVVLQSHLVALLEAEVARAAILADRTARAPVPEEIHDRQAMTHAEMLTLVAAPAEPVSQGGAVAIAPAYQFASFGSWLASPIAGAGSLLEYAELAFNAARVQKNTPTTTGDNNV